jgi:7-carboxy-7-deazaguanine synthase
MKHKKLIITEIFLSFQGESTYVGRPTVFIRLSTCNLNCKICDTIYAKEKGSKLSISEILNILKNLKTKYVCITGGEPLLQKNIEHLLKELLKLDKKISIETNGSINIKNIDKKIKKIIDVKTPSTKEEGSFNLENLKHISKNDEIKFLISSKKDFNFALSFIKKHDIQRFSIPILMSPNLSKKSLPKRLATWIVKSKIPLIFQPQIHKIIKEEPIYLLKI